MNSLYLGPLQATFDNSIGEYSTPTIQATERGTIITAWTDKGQSPAIALLLSTANESYIPLKSAIDFLTGAFIAATDDVANAARDKHPAKMPEFSFAKYVGILRQPFRETIAANIAAVQSALNERSNFVGTHVLPIGLATIHSAHILSQDTMILMKNFNSMTADQLAVLMSMRGLLKLPNHAWADVEIQYVVAANVEGIRSVGSTQFSRRPTIENPAAFGVDKERVREFAEARIKVLDRANERADDVAQMLQQICTIIAALSGKSPQTAWAALYD